MPATLETPSVIGVPMSHHGNYTPVSVVALTIALQGVSISQEKLEPVATDQIQLPIGAATAGVDLRTDPDLMPEGLTVAQLAADALTRMGGDISGMLDI